MALLVAQQNVFSFSTRKAGEDPVVGYLAHLVAATYGFNFSLAHLTALHLHDLPGRSILNNWAFPAASIVVHRLKTGQRRGQWEAREQLHNMTTPPDACIPPVVFAWAPRQRDLRCLMPRLWSACLRIPLVRLDLFESLPSRQFHCRAVEPLQQTLQQNRALHRSTTQAPRHAPDVELYSSTALQSALHLYSSTALYTLHPLHPPSVCAAAGAL